MLTTLRKRLNSDESGFTLVELLVVMIIIAILMAIAVPIFLSQKNKAVATSAKSNAKNIADWLDSCAAGQTDGTYTACTMAQLAIDEPGLAKFTAAGSAPAPAGASFTTTADTYTVYASTRQISAKGNSAPVIFTITKDSNGVAHDCTSTDAGVLSQVCPGGANAAMKTKAW